KYKALVVAELALATNQGQKSIFVVKDDNTVDERRVKVGRLQENGLRVIEEGLEPGEKVVVNGLQRVRGPVNGVRMSVTPTTVPMPVMQAPAEEKSPRKAAAKEAKKETTGGRP